MKKKVKRMARPARPEPAVPHRRDPLDGGNGEATRVSPRKEAAESVTDRIRREVQANAAGSRRVFWPPKAGTQKIIRPLTELQENEGGPLDPVVVSLHDDFDSEVRQEPCQKNYGKPCGFCKRNVKTWDFYVFTVWDYRSARRLLWPMKTTGLSPLAGFLQAMEKFGTIRDRDYRIRRDETDPRQIVMDPAKKATQFEGKERKPYTEEQVHEILVEEAEASRKRREAKDKSSQDFGDGGKGGDRFGGAGGTEETGAADADQF